MQNVYTPEEEIREYNWERQAIESGVDAYLDAVNKEGIENGSEITRLVMQIAPRIQRAIEDRQQEYVSLHTTEGGRSGPKATSRELTRLLPLCDAMTLSVMLSTSLLRMVVSEGAPSLLNVLHEVGRCLQDAISLRMLEDGDEVWTKFFKENDTSSLTRMKRLRLRKSMQSAWDGFVEFNSHHTEKVQLNVAACASLLELVGFTRCVCISDKDASEESFMSDGLLYQPMSAVGPLSNTFLVRMEHRGSAQVQQVFTMTDQAFDAFEGMVNRSAVSNARWPVMLVKPKRWVLTTP
jgi:hypothetical protein